MRKSGRAWGFIDSLANDRSGATVIEYALIAFLVSIGIGFVLPEIGFSFKEIIEQASEGVDRATVTAGGDDPPAGQQQ